MSEWEPASADSRFDVVEQFSNALAELEHRSGGDATVGAARLLVETLKARLRSAPRALISTGVYPLLADHLPQLAVELTSHIDGNGRPDEIVIRTDAILVALAQVPVGLGDPESAAAADALRSLQAGLEADLRARLEDLTKEVEAARTALAGVRANDLAALSQEIATAQGSVEQTLAAAADVQSVNQEAFNQAEAARMAQFEKGATQRDGEGRTALDNARTAHDSAREQAVTSYDQISAQANTDVQALLEQMAELHEETKRVAGAVARTGHTAGFVEWEESERTQADKYRARAIWLGILAAFSIAGLLILHIAVGSDDGFDPALTVGTIGLPSALGVVSTYSAKESHRHRRNQIYARRTALELATFAPFIATLPDDQKQELVNLFTPVFFGQARLMDEGDGDAPSLRLPATQLLSAVQASLKDRPTPPAG